MAKRARGEELELINENSRHAAYIRFVNDWRGNPQPLPWWQREIEVRGTRLLIERVGFRLDGVRG